IFAPIGGVFIAAVVIAAVVTGHWEALGFLWLAFFLFPAIFGRSWRNDRWNRRYYRRYGPYGVYGPNGEPGNLPPGAPTPTVGTPQSYRSLPQPIQEQTSTPPAPATPRPAPAAPPATPPATSTPSPAPHLPPSNPAG
ncbi:MAG TPA: hypothetical protein VKQ36_03630, partial [Ktedonobacterales bacterium]|nr:hypothetical protein [Ktedonobacterales bacterium]